MKTIVYVSCPESKQIHVLQMDNRGILTRLQVVNTPGIGQPMTINPAKTHLYLGVRPVCSVVSYRIDINHGLLSEVGRASLSSSPTHLTTDLLGRTLYCASYNGSCLSVSPINEQGIVGAPMQIIDQLINCHSSNVDTNNLVVWVPCLKEDRIRLFHRAKAGTLIPYEPKAVQCMIGAGPRHMAFHYAGGYAYTINELDSTVTICTTHNPCIIQTIDIMPAYLDDSRWAADIHITPDGRWLYCSDRSASIIVCCSVSENGRVLHLMRHQTTEIQPRGFNIDTTGRYLIVSGQKSNSVTVYGIDKQNGVLNQLSRYAVGQGPICVVIINL
ncbi:6-phosphogluconolactonase [Candidatus Palibaumannia cicadellinicola]|uniref:6-phosphogluconolactonase n=1 Tax=Candidatus Palibaumannia cicadellinicola TaxID=186490 RepID=A0A088MY66_9GAMM|nr:6-phosphogluconolactonase [Candidatus Baumannia cicadellinicola]AIN47154.1 6-phosphogluconolactonase [Candidatus Baumannia cicadellinicola]